MELSNEEINLLMDGLNALTETGDDREKEIEALFERLRTGGEK